MNIRVELLKLQENASLLDRAEFAAKFMTIADEYNRRQNLQQTDVSGSLLSDESIKLQAKEMTTFPKMCYPNTMIEIQCGAKYEEGAKWSRDSLMAEIECRQKMIISEPDGIVRETMINDLLVGL